MRSLHLPTSWAFSTLGAIAQWGSGGTPSRSNPSFYGGSIFWFKTGELGPREIFKSEETITPDALNASSVKVFPKESIALAMYGATIGKVSILGVEATTNQACAVGIPNREITGTAFLYHYLRSQKEAFVAAGQGGAQPNISQAVVKAWPVPVPPIAEQHRIADKLDTVLNRVDAVNTRLARVAPLLKRFRQSVLAAATSGRLTEDWRIRHAGFAYSPTKDNSSLGLPVSWGWETLRDVTTCFDNKRVPIKASDRARRKGPFFYYGAFGVIDSIDEYRFDGEYLLLAEDGKNLESRDRPIALIATGQFWVNNHAHVMQGRAGIRLKYLLSWLNCEVCDISDLLTGIDQIKLTRAAMDKIPVPVPPEDEQTEIVRRVEILLAFADRLEARLQTAQTATNRLTPSLLAKAFRGELVPQDPNDESASELLKRLAASATTSPTRRGRSKLSKVD
jgi:type I restriction enzyme S subunit